MTSGNESPVGRTASRRDAGEPEGLPAALFRHAAERPEEPFLFVREGWDWRWSTFAEVADLVAGWAAALPPDHLALSSAPLPRAVALELAIQVARGRGHAADAADRDLLAAAQSVQSALPPARRRDIAVLPPPVAGGSARLLLAWATLAGAVLVLEPDPAALAATAAWARPTLFFGDAAAIAALRARVPPEPRLVRAMRSLRTRGRPAPPFGRLRALVVSGPPLPADEAAFWSARGVALVAAPPVP
jgi:hypothetical protein